MTFLPAPFDAEPSEYAQRTWLHQLCGHRAWEIRQDRVDGWARVPMWIKNMIYAHPCPFNAESVDKVSPGTSVIFAALSSRSRHFWDSRASARPSMG